jgi:hypothetical protein
VRPPTGAFRQVDFRRRGLRVAVVALLCMAPVPGDIGSCGQPVERLDAPRFFAGKKAVDCEHCRSCGLETSTCLDACSVEPPAVTTFPSGCVPLVHDGEVCLRKLLAAGCGEYANYVSEQPTVPSECDFCPVAR